jgi:hypothetical protein
MLFGFSGANIHNTNDKRNYTQAANDQEQRKDRTHTKIKNQEGGKDKPKKEKK